MTEKSGLQNIHNLGIFCESHTSFSDIENKEEIIANMHLEESLKNKFNILYKSVCDNPLYRKTRYKSKRNTKEFEHIEIDSTNNDSPEKRIKQNTDRNGETNMKSYINGRKENLSNVGDTTTNKLRQLTLLEVISNYPLKIPEFQSDKTFSTNYPKKIKRLSITKIEKKKRELFINFINSNKGWNVHDQNEDLRELNRQLKYADLYDRVIGEENPLMKIDIEPLSTQEKAYFEFSFENWQVISEANFHLPLDLQF